MKICFYNLAHIGDVYLMSILMNIICKSNKNTQFYYYTILGDTFFKHLKNIKRINEYEEYNNILVDGSPPENLLKKNYLINQYLYTSFDNVIRDIDGDFSEKNSEFVLINTHCSIVGHNDFDVIDMVEKWKDKINYLNTKYRFNLEFIPNPEDMIIPFGTNENNIKLESIVYKKKFFIYNYCPRSFGEFLIEYKTNFNNYVLNILQQNKDTIFIFATYDKLFDIDKNIIFCDRDLNIKPERSCINLETTWNLAKTCDLILLTVSGSSWTFLTDETVTFKNIYLFTYPNFEGYLKKLNNNIKFILQKNIEPIKSIL